MSGSWNLRCTSNLKMILQINPKINLGLPSTISYDSIFSRLMWCLFKNCSAIFTLVAWWMRRFPMLGWGNFSSDNTSSNLINTVPSLTSINKSSISELTFRKCEFIHFVNTCFWIHSRSSAVRKIFSIIYAGSRRA